MPGANVFPPMSPAPNSRKSIDDRPAASSYAVIMFSTAEVRFIGVGSAMSAANICPVTWADVA